MTDVSIDLASLTDEELRALEDGLIHLETKLAAARVIVARLRRATAEATASRQRRRSAAPFTLVLGLDPDAGPETARHLEPIAGWLVTDLLKDPNTLPPLRAVAATILQAIGHGIMADAASHEMLKRPAGHDIPPEER
jgi:hypothetical protein